MKAKIEIQEKGEIFTIERDVDMSGAVHVGVGVIPVKEVAKWIPKMYPHAKVLRIEIIK